MNNYESLQDAHDQEEEGVLLVHRAEPSRARWNHIEDLDSFFVRMYSYHQKHGFFCMLLQESLQLIQFAFIVFLTIYLIHGINYPVLFHEPGAVPLNKTKVTLSDVVYSPSECVSHFRIFTWICLILALIIWIFKIIRGTYHMYHFWDIKQFYNTALKIDDSELDNLTWHDIQTRVRAVQIEQQMCIHKRELTDLDIYHRILRQENYLVAMVNKKLLPPRLNLPFFGEIVYWTTGLRFNIQLLFFWSPWSPFENPWHIKEEYKKPNLRHELANKFGKQILWLAFANLIFAPIIFIWQILYAFFSYAVIIRKEPSILSKRRWSLYGRLYLRHFNELEHELQARLTRAYRPAEKYVAAMSSPLGTIISENVGFYPTAILAVLIVLSIVDEDVLAVEHVLTIMTLLGLSVAILRTLAPDETTPWDPEKLLENVVIYTHYLPSGWSGYAHTTRIRKEFEQLFQYGFVGLLEGILSPLLTPYLLWRHVYPRALDFVDFFRNFTVSVVGVGDICSFAQMDVRKHGNPDWQDNEISQVANQYTQGEDGKVELSLIHFTCTNPSWQPPPSVQDFVRNVQIQSSLIASQSTADYLLHKNLDDSLNTTRTDLVVPSTNVWGRSGGGGGGGGGSEEFKWRPGPYSTQFDNTPQQQQQQQQQQRFDTTPHSHISGMWKVDTPSLKGVEEMAASATYLHNIHHSKTGHRRPVEETTPLLPNH